MRKYYILAAALVVLFCGGLFCLGDGAITKTEYYTVGNIQRLDIAWNSLTNASAGTVGFLNGTIRRVEFTSDSDTSPDYDVVITNSAGIDMLRGQGANLTSNTTVHVCPAISLTDGTTTSVYPVVVNDTYFISISNTSTGSGSVAIFYEK